MTLRHAAAAGVRLIVCRWDCGHQVEPRAGGLVRLHGAEITVSEWWAERSGQ
jgi:hypothetical protein